MPYRRTPHESTGFSANFMVFGKQMYMPVDIMMEQPDKSSNRDELEYVQVLRDRLEDAYDVAREHLQSSASREKRFCDVRAYESPFELGDFAWTMKKSHRKGKCPKMQMQWIGPLVVLNRLKDITYKVKMNEKEMMFIHCNLLKPCEARDVPPW